MRNYKDEYGVQDMDTEAQETLELMHEKLDTDCGDDETLQDRDGKEATDDPASGNRQPENHTAKRCRN